jgi:hypothetical protein
MTSLAEHAHAKQESVVASVGMSVLRESMAPTMNRMIETWRRATNYAT